MRTKVSPLFSMKITLHGDVAEWQGAALRIHEVKKTSRVRITRWSEK